MLNYFGQEVTKPVGFCHMPSVEHTIVPAQRIPFSLWGEVIRAELNSMIKGKPSGIEDCVLVKKYTL